jgi:hypothetical protein
MKDAKTVSLRSEQVAAGEGFAVDSRTAAKADFEAQKAGLAGATPEARSPEI